MRKKGLTIRQRDAIYGYLFFLPWIIGFLVLTLYPVIFSIQMSLNEVLIRPDGIRLNWEGIEYYRYAFNVDRTFKLNLGSSVIFIACSTPVIIVFSMIIAMLMNRSFPARTLFRVIFFMPVVIMSGPVISNLLSSHSIDFSEQIPQVYELISTMPSVISTPSLFILDNLVLIMWFSGVQILIFMVGLQGISPTLYEAANIDGAGAWEKFWKITLPHMVPIALICTIYTVVDISNYVDLPVNQKISASMFDNARIYSFSAAMSWVFFGVILGCLLAVYLIFAWFGRKSKR